MAQVDVLPTPDVSLPSSGEVRTVLVRPDDTFSAKVYENTLMNEYGYLVAEFLASGPDRAGAAPQAVDSITLSDGSADELGTRGLGVTGELSITGSQPGVVGFYMQTSEQTRIESLFVFLRASSTDTPNGQMVAQLYQSAVTSLLSIAASFVSSPVTVTGLSEEGEWLRFDFSPATPTVVQAGTTVTFTLAGLMDFKGTVEVPYAGSNVASVRAAYQTEQQLSLTGDIGIDLGEIASSAINRVGLGTGYIYKLERELTLLRAELFITIQQAAGAGDVRLQLRSSATLPTAATGGTLVLEASPTKSTETYWTLHVPQTEITQDAADSYFWFVLVNDANLFSRDLSLEGLYTDGSAGLNIFSGVVDGGAVTRIANAPAARLVQATISTMRSLVGTDMVSKALSLSLYIGRKTRVGAVFGRREAIGNFGQVGLYAGTRLVAVTNVDVTKESGENLVIYWEITVN